MNTNFLKSIRIIAAAALVSLGSAQIARAEVDRSALDKALAELPALQYGQPFAGFDLLRRAVDEAASQPELRRELEQKFTSLLQPGSTRAAKDIACRNLGLVGSPACVPAVAALLTDPELSHMARYCLEELGNPAADAALRDALAKTGGPQKVGIITSLGARHDQKAVTLLIKTLNEPDQQITEAAIFALGRIGTKEAANALTKMIRKGSPSLHDPAALACLAAAEKLRHDGNLKAASAIFKTFYSTQLKLEHLDRYQSAGLAGLIRTTSNAETRYLLPAVAGTNALLRQTAAALVSEQSIKVEPLLTALPTLPASGQVALIRALQGRAELAIKPAVAALLDSENSDIRNAALSLVASRANAQDIPRFAKLAATQTGSIQQMAHDALVTLPGSDVNPALIQALDQPEPTIRVELLRCLAARSAREAAPAVAPLLQASQPELRIAAIEALGALADESQLSAMIGFLAKSGDQERTAAAAAIKTVCERSRDKALEPVLAGLAQATDPQKPQFFGFLAVIGGERALAPVRDAAKSSNLTIREAAIRALAAWPGLEAAPDLQALMQSSDRDLFRKLAFRAYVRLARESEIAELEKIKFLTTAADSTRSVEEKRLTLGALAELKSPAALQVATRFIQDEASAPEACLAALEIISRFDATQKDHAAPALQLISTSVKDTATIESAHKQMTRLGIPQ